MTGLQVLLGLLFESLLLAECDDGSWVIGGLPKGFVTSQLRGSEYIKGSCCDLAGPLSVFASERAPYNWLRS